MASSANNFKEVVLSKKMEAILQSPKSPTLKNFVNRNYEGEIMKTGDTVTIIQPDLGTVAVQLGDASDECIVGNVPKANKVDLAINKNGDFAFAIPDSIKKLTPQWAYKEGQMAIAMDKLGRAHALEIANTILNSNEVTSVAGTATTPLYVNEDNIIDVVFDLARALFENGATEDMMGGYTATKQSALFDSDNNLTGYSYEPVNKKAVVQLPPAIYKLLIKKLGVDRDTVSADGALVNAEIKRLLGLNIECDVTLDTEKTESVTVTNGADDLLCVIAGTCNAVTFASSIGTIESLRDPEKYQDNHRGKEYYGFKLYQPKAVVKAFLTVIEPSEEPSTPST